MPVLTHPLPNVTVADATRILGRYWGIEGTIRSLPGERERNFHVYTEDAGEFVLKVASPLEDPAAIELQAEAMAHVARVLPTSPTPRLVPGTGGDLVVHHVIGGEQHSARLLNWLPGRPLADVARHSGAVRLSIFLPLPAIQLPMKTSWQKLSVQLVAPSPDRK
jgi:Ser/Thr protein kinase RdoA (MazF antagonist)